MGDKEEYLLIITVGVCLWAVFGWAMYLKFGGML
jgi:hypothetical protein